MTERLHFHFQASPRYLTLGKCKIIVCLFFFGFVVSSLNVLGLFARQKYITNILRSFLIPADDVM